MTRIAIPAAEQTPAASLPLLEAVNKQLGIVPNLMKVVGNSPAALEGYLSLNGALSKGMIGNKTGERIALAVAEFNRCSYCLSAHSYLASNLAKLGKGVTYQTPTLWQLRQRASVTGKSWRSFFTWPSIR